MMSFMRGLLKSKLSGIVFGLIIMSMAVWGVGDIFSGNLGSDVVHAGKRGMSLTSFDQKFENYLRNYRLQTEQSITRQEAVEQGALDDLFAFHSGRIIKLGYAEHIGATASNAAVSDEVHANDAFKNPQTQKFDQATYDARLGNLRLSRKDFEQDIRDGLTLEYLRDAVGAAVEAPSSFARLRASYDGELRRAAWMTLTSDNLPDMLDPTEDELKAFFESRLDGFQEPERRGFSVLAVSPQDFLGQVEIKDADISAVYEATKAQRFSAPETRKYTQVLFTSETEARAALGLLAAGEDAATLTGAVATDQRAALKKDISNADLSEAMFSYGQQPGAVFGPFASSDLWLVARLDEIQAGEAFPLEDVTEKIRFELARDRSEATYYDAIAGFDDLIGEGLSLTEMGERMGVPVMSYLPVDNRGVASNGAIMRGLAQVQEGFIAAQDYTVGEISERFEGENSVYLMQVDQIVPENTPSFEDIRDRIASAYRTVKKSEGVEGIAEAIKSRIESAASSLDNEATTLGIDVQRTERAFSRTAQDAGLPPSIVNAIFAAKEGDILTLPLAAGQMLIILVEDVEAPGDDALSVLAPLSVGSLNVELNNDLLQIMDADIANSISIKTNQAAIEAYKTQILEQQ